MVFDNKKSAKEILDELDKTGDYVVFVGVDDVGYSKRVSEGFSKEEIEKTMKKAAKIFETYESDRRKNSVEWEEKRVLV